MQRILWCYNGFCDFDWNHIQRILCFSGAIRLPAGDIQGWLNTISHWIGHNPGVINITHKDFFKCLCLYSRVSLYCRMSLNNYYTPRFNEVERGVYWYHLVRLSVCPSVDRIVSALYLQQNSSDPFHICTSYQATSEGVSRVMTVSKFVNLTLSSFDLESNLTQWYG